MYSCIDTINVKDNICDSIKRENTLLTTNNTLQKLDIIKRIHIF